MEKECLLDNIPHEWRNVTTDEFAESIRATPIEKTILGKHYDWDKDGLR
jgi:hypothetical protein